MRVMPLLNETRISCKAYGDFKGPGSGTTTVNRARGSEFVVVGVPGSSGNGWRSWCGLVGKKTKADQCAHRPASCSIETEETAWIDGRNCSGGARGGSVGVSKRVRTRRPELQSGQAIMSIPVSSRKRVHQGRLVGCGVTGGFGWSAPMGARR